MEGAVSFSRAILQADACCIDIAKPAGNADLSYEGKALDRIWNHKTVQPLHKDGKAIPEQLLRSGNQV